MKLRLFAASVLALVVPIVIGNFNPAEAAITYSFSDVLMTDGIVGDPILFASGSFSIPAHNFGPIPTASSQWSSPLSVNFTVTNGNMVVKTFVDPLYFFYADGIGVDNNYYINILTRVPLDFQWNQFAASIVNNEMISTYFSALDYPHGYTTFPHPLPLVSIVPELCSYAMVLAGLGLLGFTARRTQRKHA